MRGCGGLKELIVRYSNGEIPFSYFNASRAKVQQVLDQINESLKKKAGNYRWYIDGDSGDYKIVAIDERGQKFVESKGKTPAQALYRFEAARNVLNEEYGIRYTGKR
jgi:hypothetical protein